MRKILGPISLSLAFFLYPACGGPDKSGKELCDKTKDCGFLDDGCFGDVGECYDLVEKITDDANGCKNRSDLSQAMEQLSDCLQEMSCSDLYDDPEDYEHCYAEYEHYEEEWEKCDPSSYRWDVNDRFEECHNDGDDDASDDDEYWDDDSTAECWDDGDCGYGEICSSGYCEYAGVDDDGATGDDSYGVVDDDNGWDDDATPPDDSTVDDDITDATPRCCSESNPCNWNDTGVCDCEGEYDWDARDCWGTECCTEANPCAWANDGACDCEGNFSWDEEDCFY